MIEKIAIFILFLGPLVFFHELGHFLFARLAGVRVETFSIGFGPKLFSFKKGDTLYAFSLIPLGGYVKMFGDDPLSEVELSEEEKKVAYTHKSKMARFWIVFGGPLANFILAFVIYFSLVSFGEKVPETNFGVIKQDSYFYDIGVRTGDTLKKVNSQEILSFDDLNLVDSKINSISVERMGEIKNFSLNSESMKFLESFSGVSSPLRAPILINSAGEKFVVKVNENILSFEELSEFNPTQFTLYQLEGEVPLEFRPNITNDLKAFKNVTEQSFVEFINSEKLYPIDLMVKNISMGSAAEKAKLKKGDILISINGEKLLGFTQLKNMVQKVNEGEELDIVVVNKTGENTLSLIPEKKEIGGVKVMSIGVESGISFLSMMIDVKTEGFISQLQKAIHRTYDGTVKTILGFQKLITGEVSLKHVGGPIAIGKVAADSFDISLSMFFRLMALISINLGVINLFPIPVLDGGHIVFLFLELVNGGPLSRKKLQYAQQFGMSLLFLLIFVALFNDISRFF
jgi:regulator of sigma E protease